MPIAYHTTWKNPLCIVAIRSILFEKVFEKVFEILSNVFVFVFKHLNFNVFVFEKIESICICI